MNLGFFGIPRGLKPSDTLLKVQQQGCRVSLLAGNNPITTADQLAATSVILTPYRGNNVVLMDGSGPRNFALPAEVSAIVPATTSTPFDTFAWWGGARVNLETVNWANDTTRSIPLIYRNGFLVKSTEPYKTYLHTGRTTGVSGQTEDSLKNRYSWNYYNRVLRNGLNTFTANRTTTSATYIELNTEIRCFFVIGVSEDAVFASVNGTVENNVNDVLLEGLSFDSTTVAEPGFETGSGVANATLGYGLIIAGEKIGLVNGVHFLTLLGKVRSGNTATWHSASGANTAKTYLHLRLWG